MHRPRFEMALARLRPGMWEDFEQLASVFVQDEHGKLRSVAAPSGDGGLDGSLFQPEDDDQIVLQYSVRADWEDKVAETAKTVAKNFPGAKILIYVTNQAIGPQGVAVRKKIRNEHRLHLYFYDRSWFLDRVNNSVASENAAELLAKRVVDPLLSEGTLLTRKAAPLTSVEAQAALVYLEMQIADDARDKGLTKLCFEALVRTALRDTNLDNRMTRVAVRQAVHSLVPAHDTKQVDIYTDAALERLTKRFIRHHRKEDEFGLMYDETVRLKERLVQLAHEDDLLNHELRAATESTASALGIKLDDSEALTVRVRKGVERVLLIRGEHFAASIKTGPSYQMTREDIRAAVVKDMEIDPWPKDLGGALVPVVIATIEEVLLRPGERVRGHLRSMADAYTLFAFLRETPDVQGAVVKMFSHGEVWLDTTLLLPLFAESLLEEGDRNITNLLKGVHEAGLNIFVTTGIIGEVVSHMRRTTLYPRHKDEWRSQTPFLYTAYALSGQLLADLEKWLETFRGVARPEDDIAAYLLDVNGIQVKDLKKEASTAPPQVREWALKMWRKAHEGRRIPGGDDGASTEQLIDNDVESFVGVIQRRQLGRDSPFGYTAWLVTLDGAALYAAPPNVMGPAMSPDFLTNYLSLGPLRKRLRTETAEVLPIIAGVAELDVLPSEFLEEAERIREDCKGMERRVVDRRVRDHLDKARRRHGQLSKGGVRGVERDILQRLEQRGRGGSPKQKVRQDTG